MAWLLERRVPSFMISLIVPWPSGRFRISFLKKYIKKLIDSEQVAKRTISYQAQVGSDICIRLYTAFTPH